MVSDADTTVPRVRSVWEDSVVQVALALSPGVSADECEAFTVVFEHLDDVELVGVGAQLGRVVGPGGGHHVDRLFREVTDPAIVVVPGGLGCARAAVDEELLGWLRSVAPRCDWLVASSTGTVVLAASGLLDHHEAATHWLATPLLESYGSTASKDRVVEFGRIITCEGQITAMHVALLVTLRMFGPDAVRRVREEMARPGLPTTTRTDRWRARLDPRRSKHAAVGPPRPRNPELVAPDIIEFDEPTTTRHARRR